MFCFLQTYVEENSRQNKFRMNDCVISLKRFYFFFLKNINYLDETERLTRTHRLYFRPITNNLRKYFFFSSFTWKVCFFSTSDLMGNLIPWESRTIKMVEGLQSSPLGDMKWKVTGSSVEQVIKKTWNRLKYVGLTPGG